MPKNHPKNKFTQNRQTVVKNRSAMRTCVAYELPWSQRFFLLLRGSGSLISFREKSRNPLGPGYLRADCLHIIGFLYIFLYVDSVTKKNWFTYTISTSLNFKENCWGSLTNCRAVTRDGLASRPGGVEILLAASCYRNGDKLRLLDSRRAGQISIVRTYILFGANFTI